MVTSLIHALLQVSAPRDSIAVAADVASIVVAVAVLIMVIMAGLLFWRTHRILGEVRLTMRQNLGPVSDRARSISDNVEFITQVVRSDVEAVNESVRALTDRLTLASTRMEERIEEFNALMEVVQGEAEDIFVDTAATVRGVRESARSIAAGAGTRTPATRDREDAHGPPVTVRDAPDPADGEADHQPAD